MDFPVPGGSVLVCYRVDEKGADGNIIGHGYVSEYHLATAIINDQLTEMAKNRQRRLGIAIAYMNKPDGFALDCSGFRMATQDRKNLTAIMQYSAGLGFEEFVIEMIPEWEMSYENWMREDIMGAGEAREFQPIIYAQMLAFTRDVWETARAAVPNNVYIDLIGECARPDLAARFWNDWCLLYPKSYDFATWIGFSMVPTQGSIDAIETVYANGRKPYVWNGHFYNGPAEMTWSEFKAAMRDKGYSKPYISGETNYNDAKTAAAFMADKADLLWILQWGVVTGVTPDDMTQDRLTLGYDEYSRVGL